MNYLIDIIITMRIGEIEKYFNYLLENYNRIKYDLYEILNGGSRLLENKRNNKISILLCDNESYNEAINEVRILTNDTILKLNDRFSDIKIDGDIKKIIDYSDPLVKCLESLAVDVSKFDEYIKYIDNKLSEINSNYDISKKN